MTSSACEDNALTWPDHATSPCVLLTTSQRPQRTQAYSTRTTDSSPLRIQAYPHFVYDAYTAYLTAPRSDPAHGVHVLFCPQAPTRPAPPRHATPRRC